MSDTISIQGARGELAVDRATGAILSRDTSSTGGDGYPEIERFDVATLTGPHMDILECGYVDTDGVAVLPDDEFLAHVADVEAGGEGLL